uniref:CWH43-like N-terminal domain-containing protein n=1 Tax=Pyxicephalus adspersus TaxID=30357 RepID=A0AAV3AU58_PYXAD|nr:TPA: hypothetical protein GDO54_008457 [Pyxicephalus adspersus]
MEIKGLAFLPFVFFFWSIGGLTTSYILTVISGHFKSYLMNISYTGNYYPERIALSTSLIVSALLDALIKYLMYRLQNLRLKDAERSYPKIHKACLLLGLIASVGKVLVGGFPVTYYPLPHMIGKGLAFGGSILHNICNSILLYKTSLISWRMFSVKAAINGSAIVIILIYTVCRAVYVNSCTTTQCQQFDDIAAIIAEWISASLVIAYPVTNFQLLQGLCFKIKWSLKEDWLTLRENLQDTEAVP